MDELAPWIRRGAGTAERGGRLAVTGFGDVRAEAVALGDAAALVPLPERARVDLLGKDRARFLHGQCTQEIKAARPGERGYAFVLEPKGRVVSDLTFLAADDRLLLDAPAAAGPQLLAHLGRYVLASDVVLVDRSHAERALFAAGAGARSALGKAGLPLPDSREGSWSEGRLCGAAVRLVSDATLGGDDVLVWVET